MMRAQQMGAATERVAGSLTELNKPFTPVSEDTPTICKSTHYAGQSEALTAPERAASYFWGRLEPPPPLQS